MSENVDNEKSKLEERVRHLVERAIVAGSKRDAPKVLKKITGTITGLIMDAIEIENLNSRINELSDRITDMAIIGSKPEEIAPLVKESMELIDRRRDLRKSDEEKARRIRVAGILNEVIVLGLSSDPRRHIDVDPYVNRIESLYEELNELEALRNPEVKAKLLEAFE